MRIFLLLNDRVEGFGLISGVASSRDNNGHCVHQVEGGTFRVLHFSGSEYTARVMATLLTMKMRCSIPRTGSLILAKMLIRLVLASRSLGEEGRSNGLFDSSRLFDMDD